MFGLPSADLIKVIQILGLLIIGGLVFWLVRRRNQRARNEQLAAQPPSFSTFAAEPEPVAKSNGTDAEPVAEPNATDLEPPAEPNGSDPEVSELEQELRRIYDKVGKPDAFEEAKDKVTDLASDLVDEDGIEMNEALRVAYRRSLAEHREYLASKGLA